jgi:hypothetical protein
MSTNDELLDRHRAKQKARAEVIEAAKAARLPIEAMLRAHGQPNTTIAELLVRVENLLAAEGEE